LFLTAALSFKKGFSTRTLSEFGREPLLLLLKFQLKAGHPRKLQPNYQVLINALTGKVDFPSYRLRDLSRLGGRHRGNLFEVARFDESLLGLDSLGFFAIADEPKYDSEGQGGASQCCN
jgi:hypothetical protein